MKVKSKGNFKLTVINAEGVEEKREVKEEEVVEMRGAPLEMALRSSQVTKDLNWSPKDRGGE